MTRDPIEARLMEIGVVLPAPLPPTANYVPFKQIGPLLYLSGHGPRFADGTYQEGRLMTVADIPFGYEAARHTALNMLSTIQLALGSLTRVESVVKMLGMVNAGPDFRHHPKVMDGCSDLFIEALGDAGRHARSAVGMGSLPHGMPVEIEAIIAVRD